MVVQEAIARLCSDTVLVAVERQGGDYSQTVAVTYSISGDAFVPMAKQVLRFEPHECRKDITVKVKSKI